MKQFIEKMKNESEDVKKTFASIIAGVLTLIIVVITITFFQPLGRGIEVKKVEKEKDNLMTPFSVISQQATAVFGEFENSLSSVPIKEILQGKLNQENQNALTPRNDSESSSTAGETYPTDYEILQRLEK